MAVLTTSLSVEELLELGGEVIVRGLGFKAFQELAERYPELRIEQETNGNINIMTPVKGGSGIRENKLNMRISYYCEQHLGGQTFSPSTGFKLPDGATKSPDVAWINAGAMKQIDPAELEGKFVPIVPDFVAELRSKSDPLNKLIQKMEDSWIANGVKLAWLIDPYEEKVHIYRADGTTDTVEGFKGQKISGESVLPGFELVLDEFRLLTKQ